MPQRDLLLPWRSALDNAALAPSCRAPSRGEARRRAAALFERFGLEEFASARPDELSGGMRQRVAFARTLLADKPVLLLDEPFASLDSITRAELQEWLAGALADEPRTTLLVTHDIEEALYAVRPRARPVARGPAPSGPRSRARSTAPRRAREVVTSRGVLGAAPARAGGARVTGCVRRGHLGPAAPAAGAAGRRLGGGWPASARWRTTCCPRPARSRARWSRTATCCCPTPG